MNKRVAQPYIAIVGGDGLRNRIKINAPIRYYASRRHGGRAGVRKLLSSLRAGGVQLVVLLVRWLGHSDFHAVVAAAKTLGVPVITVCGGASQARRAVAHHVAEAQDAS